jgi:hypothetical protein
MAGTEPLWSWLQEIYPAEMMRRDDIAPLLQAHKLSNSADFARELQKYFDTNS